MKQFSIVIANYNGGRFLEQAINSVLVQNFTDYELIIVDGGSQDDSVQIIKKYESQIAWWVSEPDKGQSDAFNKGFKHAIGEYFVWLNSDDLMLPHTLLNVSNSIKKNPQYKWFSPNTIYIDQYNKIIKTHLAPAYSRLFLMKGDVEIGGPSSFFHKDLFEKYGPFVAELHYVMDLDLWLKFLKAGFTYKRLSSFGWAFRIHEDSKTASSIMGNFSQSHYEERELLLKKHKVRFFTFVKNLQRIKKIFYWYPLSCILTLIYKGRNINKYN